MFRYMKIKLYSPHRINLDKNDILLNNYDGVYAFTIDTGIWKIGCTGLTNQRNFGVRLHEHSFTYQWKEQYPIYVYVLPLNNTIVSTNSVSKAEGMLKDILKEYKVTHEINGKVKKEIYKCDYKVILQAMTQIGSEYRDKVSKTYGYDIRNIIIVFFGGILSIGTLLHKFPLFRLNR